jgi:hypothetical protein
MSLNTTTSFSALKTGQKKVNPREWEESRVDAKQDLTHESCFLHFWKLGQLQQSGHDHTTHVDRLCLLHPLTLANLLKT